MTQCGGRLGRRRDRRSRFSGDQTAVLAANDLAEVHVEYDHLEVLPASWPGDPAAWKAKRCQELAVDVLVDDSVEVARLVGPGTFVLVPRDSTLGFLTYSESDDCAK